MIALPAKIERPCGPHENHGDCEREDHCCLLWSLSAINSAWSLETSDSRTTTFAEVRAVTLNFSSLMASSCLLTVVVKPLAHQTAVTVCKMRVTRMVIGNLPVISTPGKDERVKLVPWVALLVVHS